MEHNRETALLVGLLLVLLGTIGAFGYLWYSRTYKPGLLACRRLTTLASSLHSTSPAWIQTSDVSTRGMLIPLLPIYSNEKANISVEGRWSNDPVTVQFKLAVGPPQTSFWGDADPLGAYYPPVTSVRLTSKHHLAKRTGLIKTSKIENDVNNVLAGLGLAGKYRQVSDDMFAYGEEVKTADFFNSDVLALVSAFPRNLFVHPFDGPVIEDSEITITWEGHETDPKVIEAAFHLLTTISEAAVAAK